jgi:hypothetical protein
MAKRKRKAARRPTKSRAKPAAAPQPAVRSWEHELDVKELRASRAEEKVLNEDVKPIDVMVRRDGAVYLPHVVYTRWLNRAFGRMGWSITPVGDAVITEESTRVPYVLRVHGKPVAHAIGEQDEQDDMTAGDTEEATVASALRRCCKRIGMGLELWDRRWVEQFLARYALRVWVKVRGQKDTAWRLQLDAKLPGEFATFNPANEDEVEFVSKRERSAGKNINGKEPITKGQLNRLLTIQRGAGRSDGEVKHWLKRKYNLESRTLVSRDLYDEVCKALERPGPLRA